MLVMRTAEINRSFGEEIMRQIDKVVAREREAKNKGTKPRKENGGKLFRIQRTKKLLSLRKKVCSQFEAVMEALNT